MFMPAGDQMAEWSEAEGAAAVLTAGRHAPAAGREVAKDREPSIVRGQASTPKAWLDFTEA
jgi:hypothetical protein